MFSTTFPRLSEASMKRRDRTAQSLATQLSRLGRISQANDRSADCRVRATVENLHSPSKSTKGAESFGPFGFGTYVVAGARNHRYQTPSSLRSICSEAAVGKTGRWSFTMRAI